MEVWKPSRGELCTCDRQAIIVYLAGRFGPTGWCGQSDGADQAGPYPFCGGARHESRCPKYRLRLETSRPDPDEARALAVLRYWFGDVEVLELINQQPPQPQAAVLFVTDSQNDPLFQPEPSPAPQPEGGNRVRKLLALLALATGLLTPASAVAADKTTVTATLPDFNLGTVTGGWYGGGSAVLTNSTITGLRLTDGTLVQTSDTTSVLRGSLCYDEVRFFVSFGNTVLPAGCLPPADFNYTYTLDCAAGTLTLTLAPTLIHPFQGYSLLFIEPPIVDPAPAKLENSVITVAILNQPYPTVTFTADTHTEQKAICKAAKKLTDPKKPLTTTEQVTILNELIVELQTL